jgi:alpha-glucosidase
MHTVHSRSTFSSCGRWWTILLVGIGLVCGWAANAQPAAPASGVKSGHRPTGAVAVDTYTPWWANAVIYEIYPRSFQDSNADGIGDLNGITQRLGYLESLGVNAIWIAPFYPSPQVDFGYDISDYESIDPQYGTMADFDRLLGDAQRHHIRVILDMVLNHTSDRHPWFIDAAGSRTSPHHDFYVWNSGKTDNAGKRRPPNNWISLFGGSAWQYVPAVDQFYYHMFYRQQPDLNWRNPQVEQAMFGAMRFWLNRGVAGFRLDAITTLFEDPELRNAPALGGKNAQGDPALSDVYTNNLPEVHDVIRRMRSMVDSYHGGRLLIGETYVPHTADLDPWYGGARHDELQLPMDTLLGMGNKLDAKLVRQHLVEAETTLHHSEPLFVFDNHDNIRSWDRYGDGVHNAEISRIVATILLTAPAAALIYQGQEIGQTTATPARVEDVRDPIGKTGWPKEKGRDGERTPMQWDTSNRQAGFSTNEHTWLPVTPNYASINVQTESADPASLLSWYRKLVALRRSNHALQSRHTVMLDPDNANVLTYARVSDDGWTVLVSLNMSAQSQTITPDLQRVTDLEGKAIKIRGSHLETVLSSPGTLANVDLHAPVRLPPFAAWVAEVE